MRTVFSVVVLTLGFYSMTTMGTPSPSTTPTTTVATTTSSPPTVYVTFFGRVTAHSGRVMVYYNDSWGTVCDDDWSNQDASVICGMLGYSKTGARALFNPVSSYGVGTGPIWMDNVGCHGNESSIADCDHNGWGTHNCAHTEDAGVACSTSQIPDNFLLFTDTTNKRIFRMDLNSGSFITVPIHGHSNPIAVDYDYNNRRIYWSDVGSRLIRRANLDGSGAQTVLRLPSTSTPDGLAVDSLSQLLFYTDIGQKVIGLVTLSDYTHKIVVDTNVDRPRAIVLDPMDGVMYWTDWGDSARIEKANYDGSSRTAIITTGLTWPNAIALDKAGQRIFWADSNPSSPDKIEYSDLSGQNRRQIFTESAHYFGMAYHNHALYLSDWQASHIKRILDVNGTTATRVGPDTFGRINDVHVHVNSSVPQGPNGCASNRCSHICIPTGASGHKCLCPDGLSLRADDRTCANSTSEACSLGGGVTISVGRRLDLNNGTICSCFKNTKRGRLRLECEKLSKKKQKRISKKIRRNRKKIQKKQRRIDESKNLSKMTKQKLRKAIARLRKKIEALIPDKL